MEAHFILIKIDEMAWNQLSQIVAALATVWLLPYPQLPLSSLVPQRSILPLSSAWLLYIAVSISALPGGWSCRSRLWERCVGNPIWSPQDLSEWAASVCGLKLDTGLIRMGDSLCQAGRKGQNRQASLLNWCDTIVCFSLTRYLAFSGKMGMSPEFHSTSLDPVSHLFQNFLGYFTYCIVLMSRTCRR